MTIELITAFSNHQRVRGFSEMTIARRAWTMRKLLEHGPLDEHTPESIEEFLSHWLVASSRYAIRSDVTQFYRWAVRRKHVDSNPALDVDPPRVPLRAATPLSDADLRRVIAAARGHQLRAVMLGAYAGLRCGEIAALDMVDVHPGRGLLVVRNGKGGKDGIVPLAPELAAVLPEYGPAVRYPDGAGVGAAVRRLFRRVGVDARPHDLRHTFGTAAARKSNGNMVLVASLMRHSSITTTQRYVRWLPDGRDVIDGLSAA